MQKVYKKDGTLINLLQDVDIDSKFGYLKLPDGSLICWGYPSITVNSVNTWGSIYYGYVDVDIEFPIPFINSPVIQLTCQRENVISANIAGDGYTKEKINRIMVVSATKQENYYIYLQWVAIGRWK